MVASLFCFHIIAFVVFTQFSLCFVLWYFHCYISVVFSLLCVIFLSLLCSTVLVLLCLFDKTNMSCFYLVFFIIFKSYPVVICDVILGDGKLMCLCVCVLQARHLQNAGAIGGIIFG